MKGLKESGSAWIKPWFPAKIPMNSNGRKKVRSSNSVVISRFKLEKPRAAKFEQNKYAIRETREIEASIPVENKEQHH